jgi:peptide/nickel transport system substrate-binding protein
MNPRRPRRLMAGAAALAGAVSLSACSLAGTARSSDVFTTVDELTSITVGAPMNPFNATSNTFLGYDVEPLGWTTNNPASPNQMLPALAASWSLSAGGGTLTVHLQPGARWSNGQPVTTRDVTVSAAIWFTQSTAQPYNLAAVKVINSRTVQFIETAGSHNNQFEPGVLQAPNVIVPASVYGRLLPPDIWGIIEASMRPGPAATAATARLTAIGKKIVAFAPRTDLSAGPYVIERINAGEALLEKNQYFYAAGKVTPPRVLLLHYSDNQQVWSYLRAGRLDAAPYTAMPAGVLRQVLAAGNTRTDTPSLVAASIAFDQASYPYGLLAVRQALAYLINRDAVQKVGEPVSGVPAMTTSGVVSSALGDYLTPGQTTALSRYAPDPAKAAGLLRSAGFARRGGAWQLPDGRPWSVTINVPSGFSDWVAAASVIKAEFTGFGIPTSVKLAPDYATYLTNLYQGDYPVGFWLIATGPAAYGTFGRIYGTYDGYVPAGRALKRYPAGNAAADNFLNTPATVDVPGHGALRPGPLTYQLATVNLGSKAGLSQQNAIVAKLIAATNYALPVIQLWDYVNVQFVNGRRFTDWPLSNDAMLNASPGVWMSYGYVHRK